jgi:ABC-type Na+ transport system ATPase subunit NatA
MYWKINIFPNEEDEKIVAFHLHIMTEDSPLLDDFEMTLRGYIPASDSVKELRERASDRAKAILKVLYEK